MTAFLVFTLFVCACVYTEMKCDSTCSNMLECTMYNIQQVGSKVDGMQSNMATIVNQLSQIQVQIATDKVEIQQQMETDRAEIQQQMATDREEMQQENCKPEKEELSSYVSFTAYATVQKSYNADDHVMFDAILRNYGSAYSVNDSEFICPVNAYYIISISLKADNGEKMYGQIMVDDEELVIACALNDVTGGWTTPSSSQTMVTYCAAGQKIWVKCSNNYNRMYGEATRPYSTFGVTLLRVV